MVNMVYKPHLRCYWSLARWKREKLYLALEKNYSRHPEDKYSFGFIFKRTREELDEIFGAYSEWLIDATELNKAKVLEELADVSNMIDFLYDMMLTETNV